MTGQRAARALPRQHSLEEGKENKGRVCGRRLGAGANRGRKERERAQEILRIKVENVEKTGMPIQSRL